ncbi:HIT family protein [Ferrovibrio sp.]|uniref:HIT family protein n=1 Tax=Ferrovibrio sp. TaxID=1917215 RepID=UPI00311DF746
MNKDAGCIFCRIISGEATSFRLYEDSLSFAIMDINPFNHGHALVLSKRHAANLHEADAESVAAVAVTAKKIAAAVQDAVQPDGINIVQANGRGAAQSVLHYHVHVLPRRLGDHAEMNWSLSPGDPDSIARLAADIRARL